MKLSIITICYNDKLGFEKTAKSVIAQTRKDFEWIIVDGASTDGSVESIELAVTTLKKVSPQTIVHWKSEPDKGIYNAMNKGILQAQGDYCLFLNSGDSFCSSKSLQRAMKKDWTADIVSFDMFIGKIGYKEAPQTVPIQRILFGSICHQATMIKHSVCKEVMYNEDYRIVSDWIFWFETLILRKCSYQSYNIPITRFDVNGISNMKPNREERHRYLNQFISENILDTIIKDAKDFDQIINALYWNNAEKSFFRTLFHSLDFFFSRIYGGIRARVLWLRYSEKH